MSGNLSTIFKDKSVIANCSPLGDTYLSDFVKQIGQTIEQYEIDESLQNNHVMLLGGGMSAEHEVSYSSANGIARSLLELGHNVIFVDMGADIAAVILKLRPKIVYNALHGTFGEDGCLPGMLNIMQVPYTGTGVLSSAIALNKRKSFQIFSMNGFDIPKNIVIHKSQKNIINKDPMQRPYVIKPIAQGSSIGVDIIFEDTDFNFAKYDFPYGDILVEEYIKGREIQVAVLNGKALGVMEIELLQGKKFYDYETKYTEGFAKHILPARLGQEQYDRVMQIAEKANNVLDCSGMVRAEFLYNEASDKFYILEINTHPGMTPLSICPEIATLKNLSYTDLVKQILENAKYES